MNTLDSFESALLTELRREVADHPGSASGEPGSPAFAVTSHGSVSLVVYRLDDAAD